MSKIRILPDILSNKIAAGEVVERPASVVKELAENALDAGATRILIDIEQGGRIMIRVADNGCGMNRDDALLAIERHATSKIFSDQDLFRIRTLGFRGEALPSIAAVSKFSLTTRDAASEAGTELTLEGGKLINVADTGAPEGTMVTVRQLFFNTPARRKFLKSIATEMAHVSDILASMALAWPQVQFRLTHNARIVKNWPAAADPFDRAVDVLGGSLRDELHPVSFSLEDIAVNGWISSPRLHRKSSNGIFILVNRRCVRDRVVQHALFQGYSQRLVKGQFPLAALFLSVLFDQVDVNVHPAKNEVRFARSNSVHEVIRRAVAQTLYDVDRPSWKPVGFQEIELEANQLREDRNSFGDRPIAGEAPGLRSRSHFGGGSSSLDRRGKMPLPQKPGESGIQYPASRIKALESEADRPNRGSSIEDRGSIHRTQVDLWERSGFAGMRVIGQLHDTYILCEAPDGLILIDQHAAHERVLYEQLERRAEAASQASQALLVPETVDLGFQEAQVIQSLMPHLRELGFGVEPFGGSTVVVKSVPGFLAGREVRPLLVEIAEAASATEGLPKPDEALDVCRQRAACHGAIRAGQTLTVEQMQKLLRQIDECSNLSHCPHGRPTWIRYESAVIERAFRRVV